MSTGSLSDVEDLQEVEMLECDGLKMDNNKEFGASNESNEEGSNGENGSPQKGRGASGKRKKAPPKKSPLNGVSQEGKQVQRNAANARERARMRVLSKAFSRLKTTLPWVPPDTKLSKLDTLRLASSYIAHLRQILANDKYENGYIHPVNLVSVGPPGQALCVRARTGRAGRGADVGCAPGHKPALGFSRALSFSSPALAAAGEAAALARDKRGARAAGNVVFLYFLTVEHSDRSPARSFGGPESNEKERGYDRTVYKMSSVIYTVIISGGALNFRFTCSFGPVPRFRWIPGHFLGENEKRRDLWPGSAGCSAQNEEAGAGPRLRPGARSREVSAALDTTASLPLVTPFKPQQRAINERIITQPQKRDKFSEEISMLKGDACVTEEHKAARDSRVFLRTQRAGIAAPERCGRRAPRPAKFCM
ncbi:PREDICTED: transcription factor 21 [Tinamus guttatus]|nr:PREDICTED: transcription factor 21 [Tinamus guttatus]